MQSYERRSPSDAVLVLRILVSFVIILISIVAIAVVVKKTMSIQLFEKIHVKADNHNSLSITTDTNMGTSFFVTDDKGIKFRKEDNAFAREEWIEKNGELFYFDTAGYGITDELKLDGQVYIFENGKLINIKRDTSYVFRADDELYSSIKSAEYLVWLDSANKYKGFYPIRYKQYSDDTEDFLGTENDKQYASPNMMKIYMGNIYYLSVGKNTDFAGRLYRMRPGAVHKETVGVGVTGFVVLSDDVVYYSDGTKVIKANNWKGIDLNVPEDTEYNIDEAESVEIVDNVETKALEIDLPDLPVPDKKETIKDETEKKVAVRVDAPE